MLYPIEGMDLSKYAYSPALHLLEENNSQNKLLKYDLFGVINHEGSIDKGHYTALCKVENEWKKFDDEVVKPIALD